jgi:hypothetical protein
MPCHAGSNLHSSVPSQEAAAERERHRSAAAREELSRTLMRFVLWVLRGDVDDQVRIPVRVFYKFDSGSWRSRSTRQLHKVYRCR